MPSQTCYTCVHSLTCFFRIKLVQSMQTFKLLAETSEEAKNTGASKTTLDILDTIASACSVFKPLDKEESIMQTKSDINTEINTNTNTDTDIYANAQAFIDYLQKNVHIERHVPALLGKDIQIISTKSDKIFVGFKQEELLMEALLNEETRLITEKEDELYFKDIPIIVICNGDYLHISFPDKKREESQ